METNADLTNPFSLDPAALFNRLVSDELNGCHVSKLRQDCSYSAEQRCSHLRATHGLRVDSLPALMVPTRTSVLNCDIDAPDLNR